MRNKFNHLAALTPQAHTKRRRRRYKACAENSSTAIFYLRSSNEDAPQTQLWHQHKNALQCFEQLFVANAFVHSTDWFRMEKMSPISNHSMFPTRISVCNCVCTYICTYVSMCMGMYVCIFLCLALARFNCSCWTSVCRMAWEAVELVKELRALSSEETVNKNIILLYERI